MAFRSANSATSSVGVTSLDVSQPSGVVTGDVVVCSMTTDGSGATLTLPSGVTSLPSSPKSSTFDGSDHACGTKVESGTPPANYTFQTNSSSEMCCLVAAFSGIDNATPVDQSSGVANSTGSASPRSMAATAITTGNTCDLVYVAEADWNSSGGTKTYAPPTSFTERVDVTSGSFTSITLDAWDNQAAGNTGAVTGTATNAGNSAGFTVFLIGLKLSAGGGATPRKFLSLTGCGS